MSWYCRPLLSKRVTSPNVSTNVSAVNVPAPVTCFSPTTIHPKRSACGQAVLAIKGPLRRFAPLTAPGRREKTNCYERKGLWSDGARCNPETMRDRLIGDRKAGDKLSK